MNTVDQLLADTGRVDDISPQALDRGRVALNDAVANVDGSRPSLHVARRGRRPRRLTLAGAAAATVAAVVTIPVVSLGGNGPSGSAEAASVLRQAGAAAAAQPGGWPDAAYWHVASTYVRDGKTYDRDIWIAHHGTSVLRDTGLPNPRTGVPDGEPRTAAADADFEAGGTSLTWDQLYALPTDPADLKAALLSDIKDAGPDATTELFVAVGDLLRESPAPPELRGALYDVAAGITGVRLTGEVTDAAGRRGTAVEYGGETYVIDRSTGQLLADEEGGWTATYLTQGPADTAP